jgi:hypothetical protein
LVFDSAEKMQKGLQAHDPELAADIPNFTNVQPQFQISEIIEIGLCVLDVATLMRGTSPRS